MYITFKQTGGPFGDATSNYEVLFPEGTTVSQFINYIICDYSVKHNEWGSFSVKYGDGYPKRFLEYNCGLAFCEKPWSDKEECKAILYEIADKKLLKVTANGGWSCMGYDLYLEEKRV